MENQLLVLSRKLQEKGLYPGPAVFDFLKQKGFSTDDIIQQGGWAPLLIDMIPNGYGTVEELVEAIEATKATGENDER